MSDNENPDDPDVIEQPIDDKTNNSAEVVQLDNDDEGIGEKNKTSSEIIDKEKKEVIEVSDPPRKKLIVVRQCLNPECTTSRSDQLVTADHYICSYYGLTWEEARKRKICLECKEKIVVAQSVLVDKLKEKQSLFSNPLPVPKEMVILEDSDEELETDSSGDSEFEVDISTDSSEPDIGSVEDRLNRIIEKTLDKFDLDFQVKSATKDLTERLESTKVDFEETDKLFLELEGKVDGLRKELYKDYEPTIRELAPLDLNKADALSNKTSSPRPGRPMATKSVTKTPERAANSSSVPPIIYSVPPPGILDRTSLRVGEEVLAMRQNILQVWKPGVVQEVDKDGMYKLRFDILLGGKKTIQTKLMTGNHLAYFSPAPVRLPVGTRCIGLFKEQSDQLGAFYSGVVSEPPKAINRNRYLIFFDDGYACYIPHNEVRVVVKSSDNVWEDIHPNSQEFIKKYLDQYPERPMVKLSVGQVVKTEWEGKWWITRVVEVDGSLAKLVFESDKRTEWIYRGSTRLGPLFTELEQQRLRKQQQADSGSQSGTVGQLPNFVRRSQALPSAKRRNAPYVEYKRDGVDPEPTVPSSGDVPPTKRAVARKSTTSSKKTEFQQQLENKTVRWEYEGTVSPFELKGPNIQREKVELKVHVCSPRCISPDHRYVESDHKSMGILVVPMALGWHRQITKHKQGGRRKVAYIAPCGRRLRGMADVHKYLTITESNLEIDFFNFEWWLHVLNEYKPAREFCTIKDLSYGKENIPVSCVNSIDRNYPEYVEYSTVRLPQKNVTINTDDQFLESCDCTDDCTDRAKCKCMQLTILSTAADKDNIINYNAGYKYRRLPEIVLTGIYECNKNCKCSKTCHNRLVQKPMRAKLQVFKTEKRGWGIRTLQDMPSGTFICVYVGNLYESEEANKQGQNFGDEYFAELDMIEVVEKRKDGYESDVSDEGFTDNDDVLASILSQSKLAGYYSTENSTEDEEVGKKDQDFTPRPREMTNTDWTTERGSRRKGLSQLDGVISESEERVGKQLDGGGDTDECSDSTSDTNMKDLSTRRGGFSATVGIAGPGDQHNKIKPRFQSTRKYYGRQEDVYIMDAKSIGNIGRYLNHSCNPNVFVQNVFVDTHDLRFPWVAFFTCAFVRAGGELSWDYNYEVGSIPGKELYCSCGSEYCRGKLL